LSINESFLSQFRNDGDIKVTAVTLLTSAEEERGLGISLDDNKARFYEIINGSYVITFNWKVGDKNCSITIDVSSDGKVICSNSSEDLYVQDLEENKDVKIQIGKGKKMSLKEL
jgi:hypothetical protein